MYFLKYIGIRNIIIIYAFSNLCLSLLNFLRIFFKKRDVFKKIPIKILFSYTSALKTIKELVIFNSADWIFQAPILLALLNALTLPSQPWEIPHIL